MRGEYAWLSAGWSDCSQKIGWNSKYLDMDYGVPVDEVGKETAPGSGVFEREWSQAMVQMDCGSWQLFHYIAMSLHLIAALFSGEIYHIPPTRHKACGRPFSLLDRCGLGRNNSERPPGRVEQPVK